MMMIGWWRQELPGKHKVTGGRSRHVGLAAACRVGFVVAGAGLPAAAGNVPMTRPQEVLAIHCTKFGHASTYVELSDGRILQAAGTQFLTSNDGGLTWSEPVQRRDSRGDPVGGGTGGSLVRLSGRGVGLASSLVGAENRGRLVFWRSEDGGETWAPPVTITESSGFLYQSCLQDVLLRTASGRLILPGYYVLRQMGPAGPVGLHNRLPPFAGMLVRGQWVSTDAHYFDPAFGAAFVSYSDDDGRTWKLNRDGGLFFLQEWYIASGVFEPSVAEVEPGRLLMVIRGGLGRLFSAWSTDNGENWTRPEAMPLASSPAPAQIRRLPTGHLLLVWNQESEEEIRRGFTRTRVSSAISRNGGSVWEFFQNVESQHEATRVPAPSIAPVRPSQLYGRPGQPPPEMAEDSAFDTESLGRWAYPSVLVLKDRVLIAHTYSVWEDHPSRAVLERRGPDGCNQKLKVLPLKWFYGGKEPADNPNLTRFRQWEPARP